MSQSIGTLEMFKIYPPTNVGGQPVECKMCIPEIRYYENILENAITMSAVVVDTGALSAGNKKPMSGIVEGIPIRGGCKVEVIMKDPYGGTLKFTESEGKQLYINKVIAGEPGTQTDVFQLELCGEEYLKNEIVRIRGCYTGKISETIQSILLGVPEGLESKKAFEIDETLRPYRFIGNTWKPFKVCTWLAAKSNPPKGIGHQAGYLFYENHDGFKFKSIDKLLSEKPTKKFIYSNTHLTKAGYKKIQNFSVDKNIDIENNLRMGIYDNRTFYFDLISLKWKAKGYDVVTQEPELDLAMEDPRGMIDYQWTGKNTRYFYQTLDTGFQKQGITPKQQVGNLKADPRTPEFDAENILVQSSMRYGELFSVKTHITISGDFDLRVGETIICEFPDLQEQKSRSPNAQSSGTYMIASLCHRLTVSDCHSSITIVRDSLPEQSHVPPDNPTPGGSGPIVGVLN